MASKSGITNKRLTIGSKFAMTATATIAILGAAYVIWFFYAVYVRDPREYGRNEANYSLIGAILGSIMLTLGVATVALSRFIWHRIAGRGAGSKKINSLVIVIMLFPFPLAPVSPTTMIFVIFALLLLLLNRIFGRSVESRPGE